MKLQRVKETGIGVPTSSMGDIAFLLIIFFIVTSTFMKEAHVKLTPPASKDIARIKESPLSVTLDTAGVVRLQGVTCQVVNLESAVSTLIADRKDKTVMLKIDKDMSQRVYGKVIMALSKAGAEIALVGTEQKN